MDAEKRIEELEDQVSRLRHELRAVEAASASESPRPEPSPARSQRSITPAVSDNDDMGVWTVWLSRLAVVFVTVAIILAAERGAASAAFEPRSMAVVAYGLAALGLFIGSVFPDRRSFFANVMLGAGSAAAYYTTYAVFFVSDVQLVRLPWLGLSVLLAGLLAISALAALRRSHVAAVMGYALAYYTATLSAREAAATPHLAYSLAIIATAPMIALLLHMRFHWRFLIWLVLAGTYVPFVAFLYLQPPAPGISAEMYFWLSRGALTAAFVSLGLASVLDVRREDIRSRGVLGISLLNSLLFLPIVWMGIQRFYADTAWSFRLSLTVILAFFALLAETRGSRKNYLFQAYIAQAFAMAVLSIFALYSGPSLWPALALACFALAVFYQQSGAVLLKAGSILLLVLAGAGAALAIKSPGYAILGQHAIPARWLACGGPAVIFFLIAIYYERATRRRPPRKRERSGHWFLADSFLDPPTATVAMLYAAAGALLLMVLTITDRRQEPDLPYLLGALSIALAIAGFLASTPQLEVGAVLLLVAAHVSFHFFLLVDKAGFEQSGGYVYGTAILAVYTYLAGLLWERYLKRVGDDRAWEHNLVAPIPHLGATYMVAALVADRFGQIYTPLTYSGVGAILVISALLVPFPGLKVAGLGLLALGAVFFANLLYAPAGEILGDPAFLAYLIPFLTAFALSERALYYTHKRPAMAHRMDDTFRTILVAAGGALGLLAVNKWAAGDHRALYWLGHGLVGIGLSFALREIRYRWAAALILTVAVLDTLFSSTEGRASRYQFAAFAGLAVITLLAVLLREYKRRKTAAPAPMSPNDGPALDE